MSVDNGPRPLAGEGDRVTVGEGIADPARKKQPLTPGFAVPSPLEPLERELFNRGPSESKLQTRDPALLRGVTGPRKKLSST
jgi:hypothetical protein